MTLLILANNTNYLTRNKLNNNKGIDVKDTDCDTCFKAFNVLCEELDTSELVTTEDFQYWMFERGYKAAMEKMIKTNRTDYPLNPLYSCSKPVTSKQALN